MERVYLGDSVYACIENGMIKIYTDNGYGPQNEIFLEPEVATALIDYVIQKLHLPDVSDIK